MQTQTMSKVPPSQTSILPPLQNLPSWSRSSLERRRQPRPILRDQLNIALEDNEKDFGMTQDQSTNLNPSSNGLRTVSAPSKGGDVELNQRVVQMEKSLEFVQNEHAQVLENLHKEIERLKTENKELNFKLVMSRSGVIVEETSPVPSVDITEEIIKAPVKDASDKKTQNKEKEIKPEKLESENLKKESSKPKAIETKNNSRNSATSNSKKRALSGKKATPPPSGKKTGTQQSSGKSTFLSKARARQIEKDSPQVLAPNNTPNKSRSEQIRRTPQSPVWSAVHGGQKMLIVTLNKDKTMQVHVPTENGPRSPTLSECKTIIVEQQETNHKQAKELLKLRADLREAIMSQKWNQNSYIVGKSFRKMETASSSSSAGTTQVNRHLPRLPFREPISGRLQARGPVAPEKVSLPALRPNINSVVADRRRRQQAILRGRMGKKDFCSN